MRERHKNADVIIAFAEGKTIQHKYADRGWLDYTEGESTFTPINCSKGYEWRIKPDKKKGWINIYGHNCLGRYVFATKPSADAAHSGISATRIACIEIEYEEG